MFQQLFEKIVLWILGVATTVVIGVISFFLVQFYDGQKQVIKDVQTLTTDVAVIKNQQTSDQKENKEWRDAFFKEQKKNASNPADDAYNRFGQYPSPKYVCKFTDP